MYQTAIMMVTYEAEERKFNPHQKRYVESTYIARRIWFKMKDSRTSHEIR